MSTLPTAPKFFAFLLFVHVNCFCEAIENFSKPKKKTKKNEYKMSERRKEIN